jgi:hypothetical protein
MHLTRFLPIVATAHRDRRNSPRLDVRDRVLGTVVATGEAVRVVDLSFGGCLIAGSMPFVVGSVHQLQLQTANGEAAAQVAVRVVHSRRADSQSPETHLTGFRFVTPRTAAAAADFDLLMDAVTEVLSFGGSTSDRD